MRSDVIMHVTAVAPVDGVTSAPADSRNPIIRHNVSLHLTDTQCKITTLAILIYIYTAVYIILRNQATSFDGVIPSGSLPLYF